MFLAKLFQVIVVQIFYPVLVNDFIGGIGERHFLPFQQPRGFLYLVQQNRIHPFDIDQQDGRILGLNDQVFPELGPLTGEGKSSIQERRKRPIYSGQGR
ncbi:MAG: hypothetical protein MZV63_58360 [Marinilabiliales bacterium]|nr:hypothetical protein [Marinilabiliales bacterium]